MYHFNFTFGTYTKTHFDAFLDNVLTIYLQTNIDTSTLVHVPKKGLSTVSSVRYTPDLKLHIRAIFGTTRPLNTALVTINNNNNNNNNNDNNNKNNNSTA